MGGMRVLCVCRASSALIDGRGMLLGASPEADGTPGVPTIYALYRAREVSGLEQGRTLTL